MLIAADVTITVGTATIAAPTGTTSIHAVDDDMVCGPCVLARWLYALDMTVIYQNGSLVAAVSARAPPLAASLPNMCRDNQPIADATRQGQLLPPIEQWGPIPELAPSTSPVRPVYP